MHQWCAPVHLVCTSTGYELQPVWVNVCVRSKFDKGYVLRSTHCETAAVRPQDIPRCGRPAPGLAPTQHLCIVFQSRVRVLDVIRNAHSVCRVRVLLPPCAKVLGRVWLEEGELQRGNGPTASAANDHAYCLSTSTSSLVEERKIVQRYFAYLGLNFKSNHTQIPLSMRPLNNLILI